MNRQEHKIEMIASENFVSRAVMEAVGSALTNKYAEGYPGKRYYGGCEFVDEVETMAIERLKALFGAEHAQCSASQRGKRKYSGISGGSQLRRYGHGHGTFPTEVI